MTLYNTLDQDKRFMDYHVSDQKPGQQDLVTYSYMQAREIYENLGQVMGFDKEAKE